MELIVSLVETVNTPRKKPFFKPSRYAFSKSFRFFIINNNHIVVVWIFFFNKYMIQNPVFFVYNVIMLSIVYAIFLGCD